MNEKELWSKLEQALIYNCGCTIKEAAPHQIFKGCCIVVRDLLANKLKASSESGGKHVYYMSMEFLVGRSLKNNLFNLGLSELFERVLADCGIDINDIYDEEPDAGLGNGGLGRLAACYMDAMAGLGIAATGFSIRYEFGIFRQKIIDGWQMEFPDNWLEHGDTWLVPRSDESYEVSFGGTVRESFADSSMRVEYVDNDIVRAVPYDMYISGYDSDTVNKLVLWSAKSPKMLDMSAFSRGDYAKALESNNRAEVISAVLYPADDHEDGKRLRLRQQYLLASASLQSIIAHHKRRGFAISELPQKVAIHINDTHPALCVPELMRLLVDDNGCGWDEAWDICRGTISYTNHTVMSEALERWSERLFAAQLPRIYSILREIDRRYTEELYRIYPGDVGTIEYMRIISHGEIRMANVCLASAHTINGVSKLHSDILKKSIFRDSYKLTPERFDNVTNGIAYRRWLCQANPELSGFVRELIGDSFMRDASKLVELDAFASDRGVLSRLMDIKHRNKERLAEFIMKKNGIRTDPHSIFDVQIKRLHEYKRQLLNVLQILATYLDIKYSVCRDMPKRTFIFAAKASPGYFMAKQIIRLICAAANLINSDVVAREYIKVVFLEDYRVSLAELIIPAADISEQISAAGKEASGTGNMKLMINGAVTIGTLDGANVEIAEQVGEENMFLFGLHANEAEELRRRGYDPSAYIRSDERLREVVNMLRSGALGTCFDDIADSLLTNRFGEADAYMTLADFSDYRRAQKQVSDTYLNRERFAVMSLKNISRAGIFSADRAVAEYAERIWHLRA